MESYIDEYNNLVDKKCKEQLKIKKNKSVKDILNGNAKYIKDLNAYVVEPTLTKKQFMNGIKNVYNYLGKSFPREPVFEDIYEKVFNTFTFEQFMEFMDLAQFGGFSSLDDAYKSFIDDLRMAGKELPSVQSNVFEEVESVTSEESGSPIMSPFIYPQSLLFPSRSPSFEPSPLTSTEFSIIEAQESKLTGPLSEGLVSRRGAPPLLQLPTDIQLQLSLGGISQRIGESDSDE
jgi:hypothetical protein